MIDTLFCLLSTYSIHGKCLCSRSDKVSREAISLHLITHCHLIDALFLALGHQSLELSVSLALFLFTADTKRKVEQISEELRNLDEILSKDEKNEGVQDDKTEESAVRSDESSVSESETKG